MHKEVACILESESGPRLTWGSSMRFYEFYEVHSKPFNEFQQQWKHVSESQWQY